MRSSPHYFSISRSFLLISPLLFSVSFVIPGLQGAVPAFIYFMGIVLLCLFSTTNSKISRDFFTVILIYISIYFVQQFIILIFGISETNIILLHLISESQPILFSTSFLTQSLYLLAGFCCYLVFKFYYQESWLYYIKVGLVFIIMYGVVFEFLWFLFFGVNGDFISNRTFSSGNFGSSFQLFNMNGIILRRVDSLVGEPSMFALTIFPFVAYFFLRKDYFFSLILFVGGALSFSSIYFVCVGLFFIIVVLISINNVDFRKKLFLFLIVALSFLFIFGPALYAVLLSKILGESTSGIERSAIFYNHVEYWFSLPLLSKLIGIGFGVTRSNDFLTTLLVNMGLVGLFFYLYCFLRPLIKDGISPLTIGLFFSAFICLTAVPEFSYLGPWMLLGIYQNGKLK